MSSFSEGRVPHERSRSVSVTSKQSRGRAEAERGDQILRPPGESGNTAQVHPEEKVRIVLEGFRREVTVNDLCRREGIKPHSYYAWTKEFMEAGKERLVRDTVRDATRQEIGELKRENGELKHLVGELSLQVSRLKKTAIPMLDGTAGTSG